MPTPEQLRTQFAKAPTAESTAYLSVNQTGQQHEPGEPTVRTEHVGGNPEADRTAHLAPVDPVQVNMKPVAEKWQHTIGRTLRKIGTVAGTGAGALLMAGGASVGVYSGAQINSHDTAATALLNVQDKISPESFDAYLQDFRSHKDTSKEWQQPMIWSLFGAAAGTAILTGARITARNSRSASPKTKKQTKKNKPA